MTGPVSFRRPQERFSRPPHDRSIRVCVCLREEDDIVLAGLSMDGFIIARATPEELNVMSSARGVEAIVVDADLPDVLSNIAKIRRSDSVISTLPIVLVGVAGASLRSGIDAVEAGGDYVTYDLRFHQGLLKACKNRMLVQMSKALSALLRTSFEISTTRKDGPRSSLPLHRAVLDAVIARQPARAERAILVLIDGAHEDIEKVLAKRKQLPKLNLPASLLRVA